MRVINLEKGHILVNTSSMIIYDKKEDGQIVKTYVGRDALFQLILGFTDEDIASMKYYREKDEEIF